MPEGRLLADETYQHIDAAIAALPPAQREVITLRDAEGWSSAEECNVWAITEMNQRVLLHRAVPHARQPGTLFQTRITVMDGPKDDATPMLTC
jgi:RNA polymerase sigma-70 factor (ECF subfamily)